PLLSLIATPPTATYTLSLHDALPICGPRQRAGGQGAAVEAEDTVRDVVRQSGNVSADVDIRSAEAAPDRKVVVPDRKVVVPDRKDRKSTRLNSSHVKISYAVFCLKKK